jgi:hypothetical protein
LFDRYLPYAIAFGLEKSWVEKFSRVPTPAPRWYSLPRWTLGAPSGRAPVGAAGGGIGGGPWRAPSLQSISNQAGRSLQESSNALVAMFNTAGRSFASAPASLSGSARVRGGSSFSGGFSGASLAFAVLKGFSGGGGGGFS